MKVYVAITDQRWFEFLSARPYLNEANFWMPSGGPANFGAVAPGEPFLFKTHHPDNRIVGGGFLSDYTRLRLSEAWEFFGEANGVGSIPEMKASIARYRHEPLASGDNPVIGCAMLRDTAWYPEAGLRPSARELPTNLVRGKSFTSDMRSGSVIEEALQRLITAAPQGLTQTASDLAWASTGPMFGRPRLQVPRLGQAAFSAKIQTAYERRCAITGAKISPALQAAHIRPVSHQGQHRVDNGLLLRADVHIMFDQGYLGVRPDTAGLVVSRRLRESFGNGEEFYALAGRAIRSPAAIKERPNAEFLTWHLDTVFDH